MKLVLLQQPQSLENFDPGTIGTIIGDDIFG